MTGKIFPHNLEASYANYLKVGHNAFEFLFDFGLIYHEDNDAKFHTRIITAPIYAKAFLRLLQECVDLYEQEYGEIPDATIANGGKGKRWLL